MERDWIALRVKLDEEPDAFGYADLYDLAESESVPADVAAAARDEMNTREV